MQRAALQRGFEADVHNLLACFVAQHGDTASFEGFKHVWCVHCAALHISRVPTPPEAVRFATLTGAATASR